MRRCRLRAVRTPMPAVWANRRQSHYGDAFNAPLRPSKVRLACSWVFSPACFSGMCRGVPTPVSRPLRADNLLQSESQTSFGCAWTHTQPCPTQTHSGRPAATTAHYSRSSGPFRNSDKTRIKNGGIFRISVGFPCMLRHSSVCVSFRPAPFIYQLSRWRAPSSRLP